MSEVLPAILASDQSDLESKLSEIPEGVKCVHIDVLEKDFWTPHPVKQDFEVHLMVENPEKIIGQWVERGAKRILVHKCLLEALEYKDRAEIGLALELDVPLEGVEPLFRKVDFVHLMSIAKIGAQGRPLDERIFDRIKEVKGMFPKIVLSVDGGIKAGNFKKFEELGVDRTIVGSGFKELWQSLTKN